ncbi:hypothetical protein ACDX77_12995 [Bacillus velezensis]|uniref:hypothetical protein n=1 Tax=Bacillus velezensis TaxID=492670 RepID=UPI003558AB61
MLVTFILILSFTQDRPNFEHRRFQPYSLMLHIFQWYYFLMHKHQEVSALNNIRRLRAYFQSHRKIGLAADLLTAVLLISLSILFYGCRQGAFNGFFMYVLVSNFIGSNASFIDFSTSGKNSQK